MFLGYNTNPFQVCYSDAAYKILIEVHIFRYHRKSHLENAGQERSDPRTPDLHDGASFFIPNGEVCRRRAGAPMEAAC